MQLVFNPACDTASHFYDPLLLIIGRLTNFKSGVGVSSKQVIHSFLDTFFLENENNQSVKEGESFARRNVVTRRIGFAFRNQREKYCGKKAPLTVLIPDTTEQDIQAYYDYVDSILDDLEKELSPEEIIDFLQFVEDQVAEYHQKNSGTSFWGLTEKGVKRAFVLEQIIGNTTANGITDVVVCALGELTRNHPHVYLTVDQIMAYVLEDLGERPENFQFRLDNVVVESCETLSEEKKHAAYVLEDSKSGSWCLTLRGIARYQELSNLRNHDAVKSVTAMWLDQYFQATIRAISGAIAKSCPLSVNMGLIDSHAYDYLNYLLVRDGMFSQIVAGKVIFPSTVAQWAVRYTFSQFRNWGTDAAMRTLRTALTETERKKIKPDTPLSKQDQIEAAKKPQDDPWNARTISPTFASVAPTDHLLDQQTERTICYAGTSEDGEGVGSVDFVGGDLRHEVLDRMGMDETLDRIDVILRRRFADPDSYIQIWYQMYQEDSSASAISERLKTPVSEIRKKIRAIRGVLQRAVQYGELELGRIA